ncbi:MAG: hypothetical protein GF313_16120 [Caldithrix sp.]|nr:hypothetical protein [Caldithrix sp.]
MKNYFFTFVMLVMVYTVNASFAMNPTIDVEEAKATYCLALDNQVDGVVESAIFNLMLLKRNFPEHNYTDVQKKLANIVKQSQNKTMCTKAYVALSYLKYPERFAWLDRLAQQNPKEAFTQLCTELEKQTSKTSAPILVKTH